MRVLVVTAHPHYAGTYTAGTILNHVARGDEVCVVSLTHGELMTNRFSPQELKKINVREAEASAEVLGVKDLRILSFPDAGLRLHDDLLIAVNNVIRDTKPDSILSHFAQDTHPDLRTTGQAVIDSCFYALLVSGHWAERYPSHWTGRLYAFEYPELTLNFAPDVFVDISDQIEKKRASLRCFQVHIDSNFKGDLEVYESCFLGTNRYWGLESGALYAEAYRQIKIHEVHTKAVKHLL
jgi:LmbE family N-acetylglucosaminyl deacetylase